MENGYDKNWQVLLNNVGPEVNSGIIPLAAFDYFPNDTGIYKAINTFRITGITIQVAYPNLKTAQTVTFTIKDVKLYYTPGGIINANRSDVNGSIGFNGTPGSLLKLTNRAGTSYYAINLFSANGRAIQSLKNIKLNTGTNSIRLNNLSKGIYLITITGKNLRRIFRTAIM